MSTKKKSKQCKSIQPGFVSDYRFHCTLRDGHDGNHRGILGEWSDSVKQEKKSTFGTWFKKQFGRDVLSDLSKRRLEQEALAAQQKALRLERQSSEEDRMDDVRDAALKGWVAGYDRGYAEGYSVAKKEMGK